MNYRILLLLALFAILVGCTKDDPKELTPVKTNNIQTDMIQSPLINYQASDLPVINTRSNGKKKAKKLKVFSSIGTIEFVAPNECPVGSAFKVLIQGEGNASHLGLFTIEIAYCADMYGIPLEAILGTMHAANGDEIYTQLIAAGEGEHDGMHEGYPYHQDYIFYGGTGRFDDATGDLTLFGEVIYPNPPEDPIGSFNLFGEGTIVY